MVKELLKANYEKWNKLSRKMSEEGIVLLRNDNGILPLGDEKIAVFGRVQSDTRGSRRTTIIEGMEQGGVNFDKTLADTYKSWVSENGMEFSGDWRKCVPSSPEMPLTPEKIAEIKANGAEKAVIVLGRLSGENKDMTVEIGDYLLSETEVELIDNVSRSFNKMILILNIGCNIDLGFLDKYTFDGVIYTNLIGDGGALALADIMKGKVNPSGKLTATLARHYEDYPSSGHFGQHEGGLLQDYYEDIFVGYRYFDTFNKNDSVVFPFGHGLSYTEFDISNVTVETGDIIEVTAKVTNKGECAGKEVLQLYYSAPNLSEGAFLGKPEKELCGFTKTKLLKAGESEIVKISFYAEDMASYDDSGVTKEKSIWVMEQGEYKILLGTSSDNVRQVGVYTQKEKYVTERCYSLNTTLSERLIADGSYEELWKPEQIGEKLHSVLAMGETVIKLEKVLKTAGSVAKIKLLPGTSGGYKLTLCGAEANSVQVTLNGTIIRNPKKFSDNEIELVLPLSRCEMTVELLENCELGEIKFEKIDAKTFIAAEGENIIEAQSIYEASFCVDVENYDDDGFGNSGCRIKDLGQIGQSVVYKIDVEEAGNYDIVFKYCYSGKTCNVNDVLTLAVSNIAHPLCGMIFENTYNEGEKRIFKTTNAGTLELPKGISYIKLVVAAKPFPDFSRIILTRNENHVAMEDTDFGNLGLDRTQMGTIAMIEEDSSEKTGIQFIEVCRNKLLMKDFLDQLSNRELATIVSGTSLNATPYGNVGCNHPLFSRGLPPAQTADGPGGLYQIGLENVCYAPTVIMAGTFNREIYREYGEAMAEECTACGVDLWLAPAVNILRNPCGGRNYSYCSEDPFVSGICAAEQIIGLQRNGVGAVLKHYCANNSEYERLKSNSRVSERALREIYIKAFQIAIKLSNPWGIMSSYNHVNDVKVCEDYTLITEIPRNEWHWDGVFFTDWWNDSDHVAELKAGHDLKMATGDIDAVTAALDSGELTREQVYLCAERILNMVSKLKTAMGRIKKSK